MKKILFIFSTSFILNVVWENLHSYLYSRYMNGAITEYILLRASFWDAVIILLISLPFLYFRFLNGRELGITVMGFVISIGLEKYALMTDRWAYNIYMPLVPFLHVGLTPTLQLGLLGYVVFRAQKNFFLRT